MQAILIAFDRDKTIDVNQGPIPLELVIKLSHIHCVWAIGNQLLKEEAHILGIDEIRDHFGLGKKMKLVRGPIEDRISHNIRSKKRRLTLLGKIYPLLPRKICTDDYDISGVMGWEYYTPDDFLEMSPCLLRSKSPTS